MAPTVEAKPEGFFGLVRFLLLVVSLALVALVVQTFVVSLRKQPIDPEAKRHELFGRAALPFGLELSSAIRAPGGDVVTTFTRSAEGPAPGPDEVLVVEYASEGAVQRLFAPSTGMDFTLRFEQWKVAKDSDWHGTLRRDAIAWGAWSTRQLVERAFHAGGSWRDSVRVDLSRTGKPRVLFAQWPTEVEAKEPELLRLLSVLVMDASGTAGAPEAPR